MVSQHNWLTRQPSPTNTNRLTRVWGVSLSLTRFPGTSSWHSPLSCRVKRSSAPFIWLLGLWPAPFSDLQRDSRGFGTAESGISSASFKVQHSFSQWHCPAQSHSTDLFFKGFGKPLDLIICQTVCVFQHLVNVLYVLFYILYTLLFLLFCIFIKGDIFFLQWKRLNVFIIFQMVSWKFTNLFVFFHAFSSDGTVESKFG